jgi:ketosteroid isomerase-like protein
MESSSEGRDTARAVSQENVDLIRRAYAAFTSRDLEGWLALLDPEIEIRSRVTEAEQSTYRGHDGAAQYYAALLGVFPDWQPEIQVLRTEGDAAVVKWHVKASGARSGTPLDEVFWQALRFRADKFVLMAFVRTEAEALEAAGLSE